MRSISIAQLVRVQWAFESGKFALIFVMHASRLFYNISPNNTRHASSQSHLNLIVLFNSRIAATAVSLTLLHAFLISVYSGNEQSQCSLQASECCQLFPVRHLAQSGVFQFILAGSHLICSSVSNWAKQVANCCSLTEVNQAISLTDLIMWFVFAPKPTDHQIYDGLKPEAGH